MAYIPSDIPAYCLQIYDVVYNVLFRDTALCTSFDRMLALITTELQDTGLCTKTDPDRFQLVGATLQMATYTSDKTIDQAKRGIWQIALIALASFDSKTASIFDSFTNKIRTGFDEEMKLNMPR